MDEHILICLFVLAMGACIGSFLNVVALRALSKESIVFPSSKCPKCDVPIKWYDNIPIFSYFLTIRGKCRSCGEKVSIQYPIVEGVTAILFLAVFLAFGISWQTLLLLILICISIVITITDTKEEVVFDSHSWILIITSIVYSAIVKDIKFALIGCLFGAIIMELIARASYYLIKKEEKDEVSVDIAIKSDGQDCQEFDINKYIKQNKRAFGEGDTYLAAGVGAFLGLKYFVIAFACAVFLQALCILPQFLINLYKEKQIRLLISISLFIFIAGLYFILSNLLELNLVIVLLFIFALVFFAIDAITKLKKTVNKESFKAIPFGPALLATSFMVLFFAPYIIKIIKKFIFMT